MKVKTHLIRIISTIMMFITVLIIVEKNCKSAVQKTLLTWIHLLIVTTTIMMMVIMIIMVMMMMTATKCNQQIMLTVCSAVTM